MADDIPNAKFAPHGVSWRERTYPPRHAPVWVRVDGAWLTGHVRRWITDPMVPGRWECTLEVDLPGGPRTWRYEYDERAIRPRHGPEPPPG